MSKRAADSSANTPSKKKRYLSKFNQAWINEFNCVRRSDKGDSYAFCKICNSHISIASGGRHDLTRHLTCPFHNENVDAAAKMPKLTQMFGSSHGQSVDDVIKAEVMFSYFVAEHNLPFAVADHLSELVKVMFHDSKIAQKFRCKRTKTTNIVNNALAPMYDHKVTQLCRENKFSVLMDESNDKGSEKVVAILVRVYDSEIRRVSTKFLAMPICNIGTGQNLFDCLQEVFTERSIPWANLVGYSSDNANVMVGNKNSVLSRVREQQPNVINVGCICHIASTCTQYGLKKLPVAADDLLIDIYYHFQHSAKRREIYREFLEFTNTDEYKLVKHCGTRWLSLQKCVNRLIQQWPALMSYFRSHDEAEKTGSRVRRCADSLADPVMQLTFRFLTFILVPLNEFNTMFQAGDSMVAYLHTEMERLMRIFMAKFVTMSTITGTDQITQVDYKNPDNQHDDTLMAIGMEARRFISENEDTISPSQLSTFFRGVRNFYTEVTEKMLMKFPFHNDVLTSLSYLNPKMKTAIDIQSVEKLARRLGVVNNENCEQLTTELQDYMLTPQSSYPEFIQQATQENPEPTPLDCWWVDVSNMKTPFGRPRFELLCKVSLSALSLPHSNADPERCFSMLRKIESDHRGNLAGKTTSALLSCKINSVCECTKFVPGKELCCAAKKACPV